MNLPEKTESQGSVSQQVQLTAQRLAARRLAVVRQTHALRTAARARVADSLPSPNLLWLAAGAAVGGLWLYRRNKSKAAAQTRAAQHEQHPPAHARKAEVLTAALMLANSLLTFLNLRERAKK